MIRGSFVRSDSLMVQVRHDTVLYGAQFFNSARKHMLSALSISSVCLSVTWVDQSKTVEVKIIHFSPYHHRLFYAA